MKSILLILSLLILPGIAFSQSAPVAEVSRAQALMNSNNKLFNQTALTDDRILIKHIVISGFVLKDKEALQKIMKDNQNKRLSQEQIDQIIEDIKTVYIEAGYGQLVNISYTLEKGKLMVSVLLLNR